MVNEIDYSCDNEFLKLLSCRSDVDLTRAGLELARDHYPELDFRPTLQWIEARSEEIAGEIARAWTERDALVELSECLAVGHGVYGDRSAYTSADGSFLHRVIETRRGIPISLSLLYMAVAAKVGIELCGVSTPMHFLARCESTEGPLFVDAYGRGRVMNEKQCLNWLERITKFSRCQLEKSLEPAGPRAVLIRMLNNLKVLYLEREDWNSAWLAQHRLAALQPASYADRRDLAIIAVQAQRPGQAVQLLECCLSSCPTQDKDLLQSQLNRAHSMLAQWN